MIKPWQLLETEYIIDNCWIKVSSRKFKLPNGVEISDYYIVEKPDVVIVVPITKQRQTLIMREFERGIMDVGYKFPAGRINIDELPLEAAKREFLEETGIAPADLSLVGTLDADPGWLTTKVFVFVAEVESQIVRVSNNPRELYDVEWVDFDEFGKQIAKEEVRNIFVVAAYHFVEKYLNEKVSWITQHKTEF